MTERMWKWNKKVETVEMDAIRSSMRISRQERIRNDTIKKTDGYRRISFPGMDTQNECQIPVG